ncbi:MAG: hypothetical protein K6B52_00755 [Clostridiales bacterium]|nr:hypothetical protein [Clostridiales bacterium]
MHSKNPERPPFKFIISIALFFIIIGAVAFFVKLIEKPELLDIELPFSQTEISLTATVSEPVTDSEEDDMFEINVKGSARQNVKKTQLPDEINAKKARLIYDWVNKELYTPLKQISEYYEKPREETSGFITEETTAEFQTDFRNDVIELISSLSKSLSKAKRFDILADSLPGSYSAFKNAYHEAVEQAQTLYESVKFIGVVQTGEKLDMTYFEECVSIMNRNKQYEQH